MERMKFSPEGGNGMSDICSKAQLTSNSFHKPAERLWNERGAMERMKFLPEGGNGMRDICSKAQLTSNSFHKPAKRLWNERGGAMERMKFLPEGGNGMSDICSDDGAVKVSTGMEKRDKRAAAPDRHKTGNFIN